MNIQLTNATFELRMTPNKRKRDDLKERKPQQHNNDNNKENHFVYNNFMEVKSISELIEHKNYQNTNSSEANVCNPFEFVRKPPKKKNRKDLIDAGCFVNPALNINGPENVVNPFEIKRAALLPETIHHCFENTGLNIRGEDRQAINPFEIVRVPKIAAVENSNGIENPGLDVPKIPLAIGIPFTPTLGCRIDFKNIPLEALTPSSMLNRHLVFSPVKKDNETTPKRTDLSTISEEAVDISKELDCYQLELENSMNEAKATNKRGNKNLMDIKRKNTFAKRLNATENYPNMTSETEDIKIEEHSCHDSSNGHNDCPKSSTPKTPNENCIAKYSLDKSISINENPDVVYEEVNESHVSNVSEFNAKVSNNHVIEQYREDEDTELFKNPAPFVRTYRRDVRQKRSIVIDEGTHTEPEKQIKIDEKHKDEVFSGIRSSIRKSIRKLIHPNSGNKTKSSQETTPTKEQPISNTPNIIISTIRHSLRRRQPKQPLATSTPRQSLNDISIIDNTEPRVVYKDAAFSTRVHNIDGDMLRMKGNLRSSLRRSKHAVKNVFKKSIEDYEFKK